MALPQILEKKSLGHEMTSEEIEVIISKIVDSTIHSSQIGAFLMAIKINGLSKDETYNLTRIMSEYSQKLDWSQEKWSDLVVDKHSTGGIGDKTSLILAPLVVACHVKVPMISGRGLGLTGGTIDKLESIPGYQTQLTEAKMKELMESPGLFIAGQTEDMVPADRVLYQTRDITGTFKSDSLVAASILSKKLCEDLRGLVLDVKVGSISSGVDEAKQLAEMMKEIGERLKLNVQVLVTRMQSPLGRCIGNALEMAEAFDILNGGQSDPHLLELVLKLGILMLQIAYPDITSEMALEQLQTALKTGAAANVANQWLVGQGVDAKLASLICHQPYDETSIASVKKIKYYTDLMGKSAPHTTYVFAQVTGYIASISAADIGLVVWKLGAGREMPGATVDLTVGLQLLKSLGDKVNEGEEIAVVHHKTEKLPEDTIKSIENAFVITKNQQEIPRIVIS